MSTFVVLGDVVPSLREWLIQRIEAGLRSAPCARSWCFDADG
jgi:hypothetical protein